MPAKPIYTIPDTAANASAGLLMRRGTYHACYMVNGRRRYQDLKTPIRNTAIAMRNCLYASLPGATVAAKGRKKRSNAERAEAARKNPDLYIQKRKPYCVLIDARIVAEADSRAEARRLRNKHLGIE